MHKLNKKFTRRIVILIIFILLSVMLIYQNNDLKITNSVYINEKVPLSFNGFKICQISDLHNKEFGENQKTLLKKVKKNEPDIIVVTGDLIDRRKYNLDVAMDFIVGAIKIAPVYYVSGNHEAWSNQYTDIKKRLTDEGVIVLDNEITSITTENSSIHILGLSDPDFLTHDYLDGTNTSKLEMKLNEWSTNENFKILLSHRPELFELYAENNMDLVFCGHAHGGQFRIPFIGGVIAPDQGIFPKFTSGFYTDKSTTMYVSRGLGNSIIPLRIFNDPEIVFVTLQTK